MLDLADDDDVGPGQHGWQRLMIKLNKYRNDLLPRILCKTGTIKYICIIVDSRLK